MVQDHFLENKQNKQNHARGTGSFLGKNLQRQKNARGTRSYIEKTKQKNKTKNLKNGRNNYPEFPPQLILSKPP